MTKSYQEIVSDKKVLVVKEIVNEDNNVRDDIELKKNVYDVRLGNSEIWANLDAKLSHLLSDRGQKLTDNILDYRNIFPDNTRQHKAADHDVNVNDALPVKQHANILEQIHMCLLELRKLQLNLWILLLNPG